MPLRRPEFERFLNCVHRRNLLVRSAEVAGLGLLGGCAVGLPLTIILLWRGLPAVPLALACLGVGVAVGLCWAMIDRPTKLISAMEADRQLDSADLLSSVLLVHRSNDQWADAVVAEANEWCLQHSPSAVLLNRLGVRAWGGIGLATALLMILSLLPVMPSSGAAGQSAVNLVPDESSSAQFSRSPSVRRTPVQQEPEDLHPDQVAGLAEVDRQQQERQNASGSGRKRGDSTAGGGAGEAHSEVRNLQGSKGSQDAGGTDKSKTGPIAGGAGNPVAGGATTSNAPGGSAAAKSVRGIPPWRSDHWPADSDRADQALRSGQIPDQYRDMIRGYFDRATAR